MPNYTMYPVDFYGTLSAATASNVLYVPVKYRSGLLCQGAKTQFISNYALSSTTNWSATGATITSETSIRSYDSSSLRAYVTSSQASILSSSTNMTSGQAVTGSAYVYSRSAVTVKLNTLIVDGSNNILSTSTSGNVTLAANKWTRLSAVSTSVASTYCRLEIVIGDGSTSAESSVVYIDAPQIESGRGTGIFLNAASSSAGNLTYTYTESAPLSISFWTRATGSGESAADDATLFYYKTASSNHIKLVYSESSSTLTLSNVGASTVNAQLTSFTMDPGDSVYIGVSMSRTAITLYAKKGSSAIVSATSAITEPLTLTNLWIGSDNTPANHWEGGIEQFLIYDRILTQSEHNTIASRTSALDIRDDSDIVFALAAPSNYNSTTALTLTSGSNYANAGVLARPINGGGYLADVTYDSSATNYIVVPATDWNFSQFYTTQPTNGSGDLFEQSTITHALGNVPRLVLTKRR